MKTAPIFLTLKIAAFGCLFIFTLSILQYNIIFYVDIFKNDYYIEDLDCPILFIHSLNDGVIPYEHSKILSEKAKKKIDLITLENHDHGGELSYLNEQVFIKFFNYFKEPENWSEEEISQILKSF